MRLDPFNPGSIPGSGSGEDIEFNGGTAPLDSLTGPAPGASTGRQAPSFDQIRGGAVMEPGDVGPPVGELQQRLKDLGYYNGEINQTFDDNTRNALLAFQEGRTAATGRFGPTSLQALERAEDSRGSWPVPGFTEINRADKPGEGEGEFGTDRSGGRTHKGIDINAPVGSRVESFGEGEVIFADQMQGYGNTVIVQHPNGLQTVYAHLDRITVEQGDSVNSDTQIGTVGRTGNTPSTGDAHLHFEIREGANGVLTGTPVDPMNYLERPR